MSSGNNNRGKEMPYRTYTLRGTRQSQEGRVWAYAGHGQLYGINGLPMVIYCVEDSRGGACDD